jgi:catechol 2,3-dioxygenase-like lactoylglutathione lyase family enzyme
MKYTAMTIHGLHHAQITIPIGAEEQGRQFYCHLLELSEIPKPDSLQGRGGFWLQIGNQQLHIGTEDGVERKATKAHLAYEVKDLAKWRQRLQENGIQIFDGVPIPGFARFECRDPFGNRLEFIQPLEPD